MAHDNRIITICADIDRFFRDYSILSTPGIPDEKDITRYHALSMVLFTILNLSFELGEEIIGLKQAGIAQSYRDIFRILHQEGFIDNSIMNSMTNLVYYRNRLAHQYTGLNCEDLKNIISKIDDIRIFVNLMKKVYKEV
jgi:uncharacterized protein YutE (UPF0331/DUF86 family)